MKNGRFPQPSDRIIRKNAVCNICTIRLVEMAYRRALLFRLDREPLKLGMRMTAFAYRIDLDEYAVRTSFCYDCMRFYKVVLKKKSELFCALNGLVNPHFDALIERILTSEEVQLAQAYARAAMSGELETQSNQKE